MNAFQNGTQQVLEFNTRLFNIITISTMHPQEMHTLTWNRYSDHLREMVNEMMTSSQFADVTLVTDDKQLIRAHRNILSACSPVFKHILNLDSSIANPVIYIMFGSAARRGDIYLFLPVIIDLTPDNLDINSARGEYLRECPPAAHQLCMNYALCHMFYGLNRYFQ